jgi:hypothetical protein
LPAAAGRFRTGWSARGRPAKKCSAERAVPAPLFTLMGKLALGLELQQHEFFQSFPDVGVDRVLVDWAQRHNQHQLAVLRRGVLDRAQRLRLDRARLLLGKLNASGSFDAGMLNPTLSSQHDLCPAA